MRLSYNPAPLETHDVWEKRIYGTDWMSRDHELRKKHCVEKGWFILTDETADVLANFLGKFKTVVEPFAGTGYLAHHMRQRGMGRRYRAYDACVSHWDSVKRPRRNYGFTKSGCFNINLKNAECVVMTWPNYDSPIAYRIARKMAKGQYLVYQGEGRGGCTGDAKYHDYLDTHFQRLKLHERRLNAHHVKFDGMYDSWYVYVKN